MILKDRKYIVPRIWSNRQLQKCAHLFTGRIVNVSGWKDEDKQGGHYKDYFVNAANYHISNYKSEACGFQGFDNEFYLDLTQDLDEQYIDRFDVVYNHTTLEHIYEVKKAFRNLCLMSKDVVILVVPFLQKMHAHYGDYWRFTPLTMKSLFEENGYELLYLNFNNHRKASVYIFAIASKNPDKWKEKFNFHFSFQCKKAFLDTGENYIGSRAIINPAIYRALCFLHSITKKLIR